MFLKQIIPTPEQRKIFFLDPRTPILLSGRAGSGKTTTAILRASQLINFYRRQGIEPKVGFFVFNNALRSYLKTLAQLEISSVKYEVWVFDTWCRNFLQENDLFALRIANEAEIKSCFQDAVRAGGLSSRQPKVLRFGEDFLIDELHYLLGRFGLDTDRYLRSERIGRGSEPNLTLDMKLAIAEELVPNYQLALESRGLTDWNQMRFQTLSFIQAGVSFDPYDILVIDEAQDLCALQIQIALKLVSPITNAITFIRDSTQRIYKNDYIWDDVSLHFGKQLHLDLQKNYRNTKEIAEAAASLMESISTDDDIAVIDPSIINVSGPKPFWMRGKYTAQKDYLKTSLSNIDLKLESVGVLHLRGSDIRDLGVYLTKLGYNCLILNQDESILNISMSGSMIYLSTMHSAKGLEFDHLFIMGYDDFFAPGSSSHRETSAHLSSHRKLLYTAITRARKTLTILSSINKFSRFLSDINPSLLTIINL